MKQKNNIAVSQRSRRVDLKSKIIFSIALIMLTIFSSTLDSIDTNEATQQELLQQSGPLKKRSASHAVEVLGDPAFDRIIRTHDQYHSEFAKWRHLFSQHAAELTKLLKTFPGGETLDDEKLHRAFSSPSAAVEGAAAGDVFQPWTNRWSGMWSNGRRQYHIWDSTQYLDGRMIQPVTLSESRFVDMDSAREMTQAGKTDMAVNIFSPESGITGWVSKYQSGRWELPHIGYSIDDTTLIWIAQVKSPDNLFSPDSLWFIFLEIVQTNSKPRQYHIYGLPIVITDQMVVRNDQRGHHRGIYYAAAGLRLASQQKIKGGRDGT